MGKCIGSLKATFDHSMKYEFFSHGILLPLKLLQQVDST